MKYLLFVTVFVVLASCRSLPVVLSQDKIIMAMTERQLYRYKFWGGEQKELEEYLTDTSESLLGCEQLLMLYQPDFRNATKVCLDAALQNEFYAFALLGFVYEHKNDDKLAYKAYFAAAQNTSTPWYRVAKFRMKKVAKRLSKAEIREIKKLAGVIN